MEASTPHDVIIIGAGPAGLGVAARLCEDTPSALFTDEEHHRYHWIHKHAARATIKNKKTGRLTLPKHADQASTITSNTVAGTRVKQKRSLDILVLDGSGDKWMTKWKQLFHRFHISHLRSPMFFHVDPSDRDGMLAFTHEQRREKELIEIPACIGKEISKHKRKKNSRSGTKKSKEKSPENCPCTKRLPTEVDERDRKDYFAPSSTLFCDYCEYVIDHYGLRKDSLIRKETVQDIDYSDFANTGDRLFKLTTSNGVHYSRSVVLAVGAGNAPRLPMDSPGGAIMDGACHAFAINTFPDPYIQSMLDKRLPTNIVVVGGGLTSAQLSDLAIEHGITKVWHLMRGPVKVKAFDVDLSWMAKFRNQEKAAFWSADDDAERLELIKEARGGGSMTARFHKLLKHHISTGRLSLNTNTTIVSQSYCAESKSWLIVTEPPIPDMPRIDYIYYATGIQTNFEELSCLDTIRDKYPSKSYGGYPALTEDLMWKSDVPLFVTGRLAALRLGPGAGNLEGARAGAERIAWALGDLLKDHKESTVDDVEEHDSEFCYRAGIGSRFASLGE